MKSVRIVLLVVAALVALLIVAGAALILFVDPNQFKGEITRVVKEKKQRTLTLHGDLKLKLFPLLAIDLGRTTLSEHNSEAQFASVQSARVSVALLPLLGKRLLIDRIVVDGVSATITRDAAGRTNIDDLLTKTEESGATVSFDIAGLEFTHGTLAVDDAMTHTVATLKNASAKTGRIADRVPTTIDVSAEIDAAQPLVNAKFAAKGNLLFDLQAAKYDFTKLDASLTATGLGARDMKVSIKGDAAVDAKRPHLMVNNFALAAAGDYQGSGVDLRKADVKLDAARLDLSPTQILFDGVKLSAVGSLVKKGGADKFDLKLDAPKLALSESNASGGMVSGRLKLSGPRPGDVVDAKFDATNVTGTSAQFAIEKLALALDIEQGAQSFIAGLATPLKGSLQTRVIEMPAIVGNVTVSGPAVPQKMMVAQLTGRLAADLAKETVSSDWNTRIDESTSIVAKLGVTHFAAPAIVFDIGVDRINVDRYVAPTPKGADPNAAAAAAKPIDLSSLKTLDARGKLRIGSLQAQNIKVQDLALTVRAADGRVVIAPISANLYSGTLNGTATMTASNSFALKQTLAGIAINPLMKDVLNRDALEGRGNVSLDLTTSGANIDALRRGLDGTASVSLRDGAVKGFNLAQSLRDFKSQLGMLQGQTSSPSSGAAQPASAALKTDFSELSASFNIRKGVASNNDLSMKSPFLRLGGSGTIDLGNQRIDYVARATVVNTSSGQQGKELAQLSDVTIPVRLTGPFNQLAYSIQWEAIASKALQNKLQGKITEQLFGKGSGAAGAAGAADANKSPDKNLQDQAKEKLEDKLKGLLGR